MAPLDTTWKEQRPTKFSAIELYCGPLLHTLFFRNLLTTQSGATRVRCQANVADILALNLPRIWEFSLDQFGF